MRSPRTVRSLETLGRERLSQNFFMRDFLHSEIANIYGIPNIPEDPELAIEAGRRLCEELLEPLQATFGRLHIRSGYRAPVLNSFGNRFGHSCARTRFDDHVWDRPDAQGRLGAAACVVAPWFADRYEAGADWRELAWYIHDHLRFHRLQFFPKLAAFNIGWREAPEQRIDSYVAPRGRLHPNGAENHAEWYEGFPEFRPG